MHISDLEIVVRLVVTAALCGLVGFERETRDQAAGMRTHVLVGLGACLFTLAGTYGFQDFQQAAQAAGQPLRDPARIAAQVVSGIGFLGAGAIMHQGFSVRGLTTAAALWIGAAIGVAVGAGFVFAAVVTTVCGLLALTVVRRARRKLMPMVRTDYVVMELEVTRPKGLSRALGALLAAGVTIVHMDSSRAEGVETARLEIQAGPSSDLDEAAEQIAELRGVTIVSLSGNHAPDLDDVVAAADERESALVEMAAGSASGTKD